MIALFWWKQDTLNVLTGVNLMGRLFKHRYDTGRSTQKWYGEYRDLKGKRRKVSLSRDKRASQEALSDLEDAITKASANMAVSPEDLPPMVKKAFFKLLKEAGHKDSLIENAQKPLKAHLEDWHASLLAKGNTKKHSDLLLKRAKRLIRECRFVLWSDLSASKTHTYLADLRNGKDNISIQTSNFYLQAVKQFVRWMVRDGRAASNPLEHLQGGNVKLDRRHERRALSYEELAFLIQATKNGAKRMGMIAADRFMLYRLTVETGLRVNELRSLKPESFNLDAEPPTVTVAAAYSKHRREDVLLLRPKLAKDLETWLSKRPKRKPVFKIPEKPARMLKADLEAARKTWIEKAENDKEKKKRQASDFLKYTDTDGRVADFHALRHTFITNLARGNVNPKTAQTLARHSTITLTMDRYSHVSNGEAAKALEALPELDTTIDEPQQGADTCEEIANASATGAGKTADENWGQNWVHWVQNWATLCSQFEALLTSTGIDSEKAERKTRSRKSSGEKTYDAHPHRMSSHFTGKKGKPPNGLEPLTCGLQNRCSAN